MEKILVVDDEPDILRLLEVILEGSEEWSVLCASSGDEAVAVAQRERPRAILLDGRMPGGGGAVTLELLRSDPTMRDTPVILMTALVSDPHTSVEAGFAGVIAKPFDPLTLLAQIRAILQAS